ncbi:TRAF3-interacting protein 1 isoform X2 [Oryzias latipes]|uniref:TRAF3-interacting protein 1 n=1 Tax=Oryzias latipes TaxID=8090 RepID=H2MV47_ORYLA|nr:TRAF3-interacting protein 1 isoform X2 [Oryzias latipes]
MNAAVVKKTQETLGKVIKKPPLMEKLLSKPPFRYLHDIFMEVIRTTGFLKGLYEENEMKSDNVNGKEARMSFLQKAIDVVALVSGEPLTAKPARIVAGHEPEKTNELLQAIGRCCLNKLSSDEAVKQVLSRGKVDPKTKIGTSQDKSQDKSREKSQDKRHREERSHGLDRDGKKRLTERSSSREEKDTVKPKDQQLKGEQKERRRDRDHSDRRHRSDQKPAAEREKSRDQEQERHNGRARDKEKEQDRTRDRQRDKDRDSHRDRDKGKHKEKDRERQNGKGEQNKRAESGDKRTREPEEPEQKPSSDEINSQTAKTGTPPPEVVGSQPDSPARIPRPSSAKGQRRRPKAGDESDSDGDEDPRFAQSSHPQENGNTVGSSMSSDINNSRLMARPGSARFRVRRQESHADAPPSERLSSAKPRAPVIMDGKKMSDDEEEDDEQFLVEEAPPPPLSVPESDREPARELDSEEEHGGLVKKILEVKKNHELPHSSLRSKEQSLVSDAALQKKREMATKEVEKLRSFIQSLCHNYQFLAKLMEYTLEDMDAMRAEVQRWRKENKECAEALLQEQRETERVLEPLKAELVELEQQIKDQQDQNYSMKANVLKNEELIQKMLAGAFYKK